MPVCIISFGYIRDHGFIGCPVNNIINNSTLNYMLQERKVTLSMDYYALNWAVSLLYMIKIDALVVGSAKYANRMHFSTSTNHFLSHDKVSILG